MNTVSHEVIPGKVFVSDASGEVSTEAFLPENPIALLTLAHGAGTDMHHAFLKNPALSLASQQVATVRFNFPYTEQRKRMPDRAPVAISTVGSVVRYAQQQFASLPLFLSGKSFGGRMSSQFMATEPAAVRGLIFYGFPLHPADKPSVERAEHLKTIKIPMLFLQGTADTLAYTTLIEGVVADLPTAMLIMIEKADHSFNAGKKAIMERLVNETVAWVKKHA
jgi:uncharacterized protein